MPVGAGAPIESPPELHYVQEVQCAHQNPREILSDLNSSRNGCASLSNPLDDPQWDSRVSSYPNASFFHSAAWIRVLCAAYDYTPLCSTTAISEGSTALLPLVEVDSWVTGRRGISLPFTDEFEPLGFDDQLCQVSFEDTLAQAERRRWKYYELRGGRSRLRDVPASLSFHGHKLHLHTDVAGLFARCLGSARTAVRKAEQAGLTVEFSQSMEATQMFHQLLCKTRSRHGAPPQPLSFFEHIQREIMACGRGWVVLAKLASKPVGGAVFFHFAKTAIYKFAASDGAFRHLQANNLVLWRAIEYYARNGFASLDMGRTSLDNSGLRRFKLGWGAEERTIDYMRYQTASGTFVTSADRSSGWQRLIFKSLPPTLSRAVGAVIYRHFA